MYGCASMHVFLKLSCIFPPISVPGSLGVAGSGWYVGQTTPATVEGQVLSQRVMEVRVKAVGSFSIEVSGKVLVLNHEASRKVIAMLILSSNHTCSRDFIAATIWPDTARTNSLASLRQAVLQLKKSFQCICGDNSPFRTDVQTLALVNCNINLDIVQLIEAVKADSGLDQHQITKDITGDFLRELLPASDLYTEWVANREAGFLDALKRTLRVSLESVNPETPKLQYAEFLSRLDSGDELACRTRMECYYNDGEKGKALKCYSALWEYLEEEFDVEPSGDTQELAVAIKLNEPRLRDVTYAEDLFVFDKRDEVLSKSDDRGADILPRIAVIPFVGRGVGEEEMFIGEALADDLTNVLSKCDTINVISRLSSSIFSGLTGVRQTMKMLHVHYLITGTYRMHSQTVILDVEFSCADTSSILWQRRFTGTVDELLRGELSLVDEALHGMGISVMANELRKSSHTPLERLSDYTLLISAITLMHRLTFESFKRSKSMFEYLIDRNPNQPQAYAYLSLWYVLRGVQGWSDNANRDGDIALTLSSRALDLDPFMSLAHTLHGVVKTNLKKDLEAGEKSYWTAIEYNQSDSLAWLLKGTLHAFQGDGNKAVADTSKAISISPFDPYKYYYYSLAGTAHMCAENYDKAIELSTKSLRLNQEHASTLRVLSMSLWKVGKHRESRECACALLKMQPEFTVSKWLRDTPFVAPIAADLASTLLAAGIPN